MENGLETKNNGFEVILSISQFGHLIKKWEKFDKINYDGKLDSISYDRYNILTNKDEVLLDNWVDEISFEIRNNYCIFGIGHDKYGVFDIEGNLIVKPVYDKLYYDSDDIFMAECNKKFGFVNSKGQMTPIIFANASFFYDDYAAVKYNYKWGFISKDTIIENPDNYSEYPIFPQYEEVDDFENNMCKVKLNGETIFIDKLGNKVEQKIKVKH